MEKKPQNPACLYRIQEAATTAYKLW